jgi:hypothetical protein
VKEILSQLQDFEDSAKLEIEKLSLSTMDEITPEMEKMWNKSTITYPQILESDHCWKSQPPTSEELFLKTDDLIAARKLAEKHGKQDDYKEYCPAFRDGLYDPTLDPRKALFQLYEPKKKNPVAICGYRLPEFIEDSALKPPLALTKFVEPVNEDNLQILLTPKFWITDLHIGRHS